jgi:hypothetical protein
MFYILIRVFDKHLAGAPIFAQFVIALLAEINDPIAISVRNAIMNFFHGVFSAY